MISNEQFFNSNIIDELALKVSYGLSGNIDKTTSPYIITNNMREMFTGQKVLTFRIRRILSWDGKRCSYRMLDLN